MAINPNLKALWRVSSPYTAPVTLRATDWISALGAALHQLGRAQRIDRMACERLPNDDLIINDLTHDCRYVVQQLAAAEDLPELEADDITETGRLIAATAALPAAAFDDDDDDEILAMGDAVERADPYGGWGMSLEIDQDEDDLLSEEQPIIETYNPVSLRREDAASVAVGVAPLEADEAPLALGDEELLEADEAPLALGDAALDTDEIQLELGEATVETDEAPREAPVARKPDPPPEFEDAFSFEEEDLSVLPDEITLIETAPRRGLSEALKEIRARRNSESSTP